MIWLAAIEVAIVIAAAVGAVYLKRAGDRSWAEYRRRQWIANSPQMQKLAKDLVRFQVTLRDSFTPSLIQAAAAMAKFGAALDALPRPTRRQRVAMRIRGWFA